MRVLVVSRSKTGGTRAMTEAVVAAGGLTDAHLDACRELGMTLAAGLELGIC